MILIKALKVLGIIAVIMVVESIALARAFFMH